jgi:hypothetical protein
MTTTRRRILAACALVLCAGLAGALDLTEGRLRLTLHEGIGRFSLSYLSNSRESAYTPLLVAQDPRTSVLSIVVGNRVTRLGEGSEYSLTTERTTDGARFLWKSSLLTVTESFSFLASEGATAANGIRIDVEVKNTSRQDLTVGLRYLFDTYLGEASFLHFRTDAIPDVTRELTLSGDSMPRYWVSPLADDPEELGMQVMTSGEGITVPDKVVFANWKRLNDASWSYTTSTARNFNLLPYSVNDSAVSQYYEPKRLAKGASATVTLCLGKYAPAGFALKKPVAPTVAAAPVVEQPAVVEQPPVVEQPAVVEPPAQPAVEPAAEPIVAVEPAVEASAQVQQMVRTDMAAVNALISEIDGNIAAGPEVSADVIARLKAAIAELKSRAAGYPSSTGSTTTGQ